MIKEAYCSFEVSKLLKIAGFKEKVRSLWIGDTDPYFSDNNIKYDDYNSGGIDLCSAPTHQLACAWIRKKGWHISVELTYDENYDVVYYVTISSTKTFLAEDIGELENKYFSKVEDAMDESLKFVLTNLMI